MEGLFPGTSQQPIQSNKDELPSEIRHHFLAQEY